MKIKKIVQNIIVLLSVSIIFTILFTYYWGTPIDEPKTDATLLTIKMLVDNLKVKLEQGGDLPTNLDTEIGNKKDFSRYSDAWGTDFSYIKEDSFIGFVITSAGPDKYFHTSDDIIGKCRKDILSNQLECTFVCRNQKIEFK